MAFIASCVVAGFAIMYGRAIFLVWAASGHPVEFQPEYVYVATALAGVVGGVAAMIFNEQLPDDPQARTPKALATPSASGPKAAFAALVNSVVPQGGANRMFSIVSSAYVIAYFLAGMAAIATWVTASANTPDLVKNLALISIGLFVAIARSFLSVPTT